MARKRTAPRKGAIAQPRSPSAEFDPLQQQKKGIADEQRTLVGAVGLLSNDALEARCAEEAGPAPGPSGYTGNDIAAMFKLAKFMRLRGWDFHVNWTWRRYNVVVGSAAQWIEQNDREGEWSVVFSRRDDPNNFMPVIGAAIDPISPVKASAIAFLRALMTQRFKEQNENGKDQQRRSAAV